MQTHYVGLLICLIVLPSNQVFGQNNQPFGNTGNQNQNQGQQPLNPNQQPSPQDFIHNVAPIQGIFNPFIHLAGSGIYGLMDLGISALRFPMNILGNGQAFVTKTVNAFAPNWTPTPRNPYDTPIIDFLNQFQQQTGGQATPTSPNQQQNQNQNPNQNQNQNQNQNRPNNG